MKNNPFSWISHFFTDWGVTKQLSPGIFLGVESGRKMITVPHMKGDLSVGEVFQPIGIILNRRLSCAGWRKVRTP